MVNQPKHLCNYDIFLRAISVWLATTTTTTTIIIFFFVDYFFFLLIVWLFPSCRYGGTITNQIKRLGASCDWSREHFTLDAQLSSKTTFMRKTPTFCYELLEDAVAN